MIVTDDGGDGKLSVICYTLEDSDDCFESETIFAPGYGKTLVLKEVDLNVNNVKHKLYWYVKLPHPLLPQAKIPG